MSGDLVTSVFNPVSETTTMAAPVKRVPDGFQPVRPHLPVRDGSQSIEFYKRALSAGEIRRSVAPDGRSLLHAKRKGSVMRASVWSCSVVACGLIVASATGFSQERGASKPEVQPGGLSAVHDKLAGLAGTWDVSLEYKIGDKMQKGKATCEAKRIMDGRFLQQDYHSNFQGKPFHVLQILGYDADKKKTIEIKLDNLSTSIMHNEGSASEDGSVLTNLGEDVDPMTKKPYKLRTVYTITGPDHFTLEWFRTEDGGKEEKLVSMTHTRKKT
jgi:hypothetical protein